MIDISMYRGSRIDSIPSGGIICHQYFFFWYIALRKVTGSFKMAYAFEWWDTWSIMDRGMHFVNSNSCFFKSPMDLWTYLHGGFWALSRRMSTTVTAPTAWLYANISLPIAICRNLWKFTASNFQNCVYRLDIYIYIYIFVHMGKEIYICVFIYIYIHV